MPTGGGGSGWVVIIGKHVLTIIYDTILDVYLIDIIFSQAVLVC